LLDNAEQATEVLAAVPLVRSKPEVLSSGQNSSSSSQVQPNLMAVASSADEKKPVIIGNSSQEKTKAGDDAEMQIAHDLLPLDQKQQVQFIEKH